MTIQVPEKTEFDPKGYVTYHVSPDARTTVTSFVPVYKEVVVSGELAGRTQRIENLVNKYRTLAGARVRRERVGDPAALLTDVESAQESIREAETLRG